MRILMSFLGSLALFNLGAAPLQADGHKVDDSSENAQARQKVLGIGGLFVRAEDPPALATWYEKHLGINPVPKTYEEEPWMQEAGPTVFGPFRADSEQMGNPGKQWILNFRVADLDGFVAQLREDGVEVTLDPVTYPNGRFATLDDPEGHPIQLWEPAVPSK